MALTLDRVRDVMFDCLRRGEAPSQRAVRKALGGGSPNEIGPLVREVLLELAGTPLKPNELPHLLSEAAAALWRLAQAEAQGEFSAERDQAAAALQSWKTQAGDWEARARALANHVQTLQTDHARLALEHQEAAAIWSKTQQLEQLTRQSLQQQLRDSDAQTAALKEKLSAADAETRALSAKLNDASQQARTLETHAQNQAIALAEIRGALNEANNQRLELKAALKAEQEQTTALTLNAARLQALVEELKQHLRATEQDLEQKNQIASELGPLKSAYHDLQEALQRLAQLSTQVPVKPNQPARSKVHSVAGQEALAKALATVNPTRQPRL